MLPLLGDGGDKGQQDDAVHQIRRQQRLRRRLSTFHDVRQNGAALPIGRQPSGDCDPGLCPAEVCRTGELSSVRFIPRPQFIKFILLAGLPERPVGEGDHDRGAVPGAVRDGRGQWAGGQEQNVLPLSRQFVQFGAQRRVPAHQLPHRCDGRYIRI